MTSEHGREDLRQRIRVGELPPPDASVVIRGGPDTLSLIRSHARRFHRLYELDGEPVWGISVFVAVDDIGPGSERGILAGKLKSYPSIYRCTVQSLTDAGLFLLPTFARPHYTVVLPTLDAADDVAAVFGRLVANIFMRTEGDQ
jgi:hypothetical protein